MWDVPGWNSYSNGSISIWKPLNIRPVQFCMNLTQLSGGELSPIVYNITLRFCSVSNQCDSLYRPKRSQRFLGKYNFSRFSWKLGSSDEINLSESKFRIHTGCSGRVSLFFQNFYPKLELMAWQSSWAFCMESGPLAF